MALPFFYIEAIDTAQQLVTLNEETSKHVVQVLRMQVGEQLNLTDGKGNLLTAQISDAHKKQCVVKIQTTSFTPQAPRKTTIAVSLVKNASRFEWFLEKATEIGITEIIPLLCDRTERQHFRYDRMKGILVSAMLQSQQTWMPVLHEPMKFENQHAYFGPVESIPKKEEIEKVFSDSNYEIKHHNNIAEVAANLLNDEKIIAWFQGRSESGPRALGNRSILVRPDRKGIKDFLNANIKFRESFRPYGCSVLFEEAHRYFEVNQNFNNPYMSYAIKVRSNFKELLKDVSHVDGTSRMQTVRPGQNQLFYNLLKEFGKLSGLYCLLNTSLNVMDEPILETVEDAKRFLDNSEVDYLIIDQFCIKRLK